MCNIVVLVILGIPASLQKKWRCGEVLCADKRLICVQVTITHWSDVLSSRESRQGVQTLQFKLMENNTSFFHPGGCL